MRFRACANRASARSTPYTAREIYAQSYSIVAHPAAKIPEAIALSHAEARMGKNDLHWMAKNRDRILVEWVKRYDAKAAPRQ